MTKITGVIETAITVQDVQASVRFYQDLFGFAVMLEDDRIAALDVAPGHVLLLFRENSSLQPLTLPGGVVPPHGSHGQHHFAFGIPTEDFDASLEHLKSKGVEVESVVNWPAGGRSLYFRDPDQHCVELMTPGVWKNY